MERKADFEVYGDLTTELNGVLLKSPVCVITGNQ